VTHIQHYPPTLTGIRRWQTCSFQFLYFSREVTSRWKRKFQGCARSVNLFLLF